MLAGSSHKNIRCHPSFHAFNPTHACIWWERKEPADSTHRSTIIIIIMYNSYKKRIERKTNIKTNLLNSFCVCMLFDAMFLIASFSLFSAIWLKILQFAIQTNIFLYSCKMQKKIKTFKVFRTHIAAYYTLFLTIWLNILDSMHEGSQVRNIKTCFFYYWNVLMRGIDN